MNFAQDLRQPFPKVMNRPYFQDLDQPYQQQINQKWISPGEQFPQRRNQFHHHDTDQEYCQSRDQTYAQNLENDFLPRMNHQLHPQNSDDEYCLKRNQLSPQTPGQVYHPRMNQLHSQDSDVQFSQKMNCFKHQLRDQINSKGVNSFNPNYSNPLCSQRLNQSTEDLDRQYSQIRNRPRYHRSDQAYDPRMNQLNSQDLEEQYPENMNRSKQRPPDQMHSKGVNPFNPNHSNQLFSQRLNQSNEDLDQEYSQRRNNRLRCHRSNEADDPTMNQLNSQDLDEQYPENMNRSKERPPDQINSKGVNSFHPHSSNKLCFQRLSQSHKNSGQVCIQSNTGLDQEYSRSRNEHQSRMKIFYPRMKQLNSEDLDEHCSQTMNRFKHRPQDHINSKEVITFHSYNSNQLSSQSLNQPCEDSDLGYSPRRNPLCLQNAGQSQHPRVNQLISRNLDGQYSQNMKNFKHQPLDQINFKGLNSFHPDNSNQLCSQRLNQSREDSDQEYSQRKNRICSQDASLTHHPRMNQLISQDSDQEFSQNMISFYPQAPDQGYCKKLKTLQRYDSEQIIICSIRNNTRYVTSTQDMDLEFFQRRNLHYSQASDQTNNSRMSQLHPQDSDEEYFQNMNEIHSQNSNEESSKIFKLSRSSDSGRMNYQVSSITCHENSERRQFGYPDDSDSKTLNSRYSLVSSQENLELWDDRLSDFEGAYKTQGCAQLPHVEPECHKKRRFENHSDDYNGPNLKSFRKDSVEEKSAHESTQPSNQKMRKKYFDPNAKNIKSKKIMAKEAKYIEEYRVSECVPILTKKLDCVNIYDVKGRNGLCGSLVVIFQSGVQKTRLKMFFNTLKGTAKTWGMKFLCTVGCVDTNVWRASVIFNGKLLAETEAETKYRAKLGACGRALWKLCVWYFSIKIQTKSKLEIWAEETQKEKTEGCSKASKFGPQKKDEDFIICPKHRKHMKGWLQKANISNLYGNQGECLKELENKITKYAKNLNTTSELVFSGDFNQRTLNCLMRFVHNNFKFLKARKVRMRYYRQLIISKKEPIRCWASIKDVLKEGGNNITETFVLYAPGDMPFDIAFIYPRITYLIP